MELSEYSYLSDNKLKNFAISTFTDLVNVTNIEIINGYKIKSHQGTMKKDIGSLKKGDYVEFNAEKDIIKILNLNLSFRVKFFDLIIIDPSDTIKEINPSPFDLGMNPRILQDHLETKFDILDIMSERFILASPKKQLRNLSPQYKYILGIEEKEIKVYSFATRKQMDSFSIIIPEAEIYQI